MFLKSKTNAREQLYKPKVSDSLDNPSQHSLVQS